MWCVPYFTVAVVPQVQVNYFDLDFSQDPSPNSPELSSGASSVCKKNSLFLILLVFYVKIYVIAF